MGLLTMRCVFIHTLGYREQTALLSRRVTFRDMLLGITRAKNGAVNFSVRKIMHWKMLKSRTLINSALNEDAKMYVEH